MSTSCASGSVRIPTMRRRVVWGRGVTIATFWPTTRFSSVDLPTLERPPRTTNPARCSSASATNLLPYLIERLARGGLLALLFATAGAVAEFTSLDSDAGGEAFGVIGAFGRHQLIDRLGPKTAIGELLEFGLVVAFRGGPADVAGEQKLHHPLRRSDSAVRVDRADERFERGGEDRNLVASPALFLPLAEPQHRSDVQGLRFESQGARIDYGSAQLG